MIRAALFVAFVVLLGFAAQVGAETFQPIPGQERDPFQEEKIYQELSTMDTQAGLIFKGATEALDHQDYFLALGSFKAVLSKFPDHMPSLRRLSFAFAELGRFDEALEAARTAEEKAPEDLDNLAAMAYALSKQLDEPSRKQGVEYAKKMMEKQPGAKAARFLVHTALSANDRRSFDMGLDALAGYAPDTAATHAMLALRHALDGEHAAAEKELAEAVARGYAKQEAERMRSSFNLGSRPRSNVRPYLAIGGGGLALLLAGLVLVIRRRRRAHRVSSPQQTA
jgi:tetratricopeptide (TPR) repeat protein